MTPRVKAPQPAPTRRTNDAGANLTPWRKGQSGNPKGRPPLPDIREALAGVLAEPVEGLPSLLAILRTIRDRAVAGDVRAAELLLDRAFGRAAQSVDVTTQGDRLAVVPPIMWSDCVVVSHE
jgi:hypothetical protein